MHGAEERRLEERLLGTRQGPVAQARRRWRHLAGHGRGAPLSGGQLWRGCLAGSASAAHRIAAAAVVLVVIVVVVTHRTPCTCGGENATI